MFLTKRKGGAGYEGMIVTSQVARATATTRSTPSDWNNCCVSCMISPASANRPWASPPFARSRLPPLPAQLGEKHGGRVGISC